MDTDGLLTAWKDTMTVSRVFGEPIERDGTTVIPAAVVAGGGGGGEQPDPDDSGGGFGLWVRPIGVYVVRNGQVSFRPAVDVLPLAALGTVVLMAWAWRAARRRR